MDDQLRAARTFKVETKRADKTFPMTSIQLSQYVGGELHEAYDNLEVDVHHPELTVYVEVRDYAAYVHTQPQPGAGGLPVGINGRAVSLLSGGIDSPVASWMIAKRGVALDMVHFFSYPYTSSRPRRKCWSWPACSPLDRAAHRPRGALHRTSRRSCAAPARRSCSPSSCAAS
ncbi:MAG: THUMP domain-containing protein [Flavonifractor plautii]